LQITLQRQKTVSALIEELALPSRAKVIITGTKQGYMTYLVGNGYAMSILPSMAGKNR
jgi:hypothetical protein